jgi:hypothetical protein
MLRLDHVFVFDQRALPTGEPAQSILCRAKSLGKLADHARGGIEPGVRGRPATPNAMPDDPREQEQVASQ